MTMQDLIDQDPDFWLNVFRLMDHVVVKGTHNDVGFGWAQREYLFSYVSQKNHCDYCYECHLGAAKALGFDSIDPKYLELTDRLYNDNKNDGSEICQQLLQIISLANLVNTLVNANTVEFGKCNMLTTSRFRRRGYQQFASKANQR